MYELTTVLVDICLLSSFLMIMSQAAINILNTSFIINIILFYFGEYLEEVLCHKIHVCLTFTFNSFIEI